MVTRERLYDAFGELIYAIAKADGKVQQEEIKALEEILSSYHGAQNISWSFKYESNKETSVKEAYNKALITCKDNGPDAEYEFLFEVLDKVANANVLDEEEVAIISNFKNDLRNEFIKRG